VLQSPNVSAAIAGGTSPEQVRDNAQAAGVRLEAGLMSQIDDVLGAVINRDPAETASPARRPS
jgi:aryl-alcohol dehydrogenase-like predicted oxidoreductase